MIMEMLTKMNGVRCSCGKVHEFGSEILTGAGVIARVPEIIKKYGAKKPYILSDKNTYAAAGEKLCAILRDEGITYSSYSFDEEHLEPDEKTVGSAFMHMSRDCDFVIGVGSGVINDTAKILSMHTGKKYIIVATAPSMDGYASMTSSVTLDGIKTSLSSRCADVIVGDTDILSKAPARLLVAGVGDMLAKYISICEWRIAALVCGEYYCEEIAELIRSALRRVVESADLLLRGDPDAVISVFDALSAGSVAMNYAGISRPASGVEHYISHVIDMRGAEFGTPVDLHGTQCAVGTLISLRLYEKLKKFTPDKVRALKYAESFDLEAHNARLRSLLGSSGEGMIALEKKEGKYDVKKHHERLEIILEKWNDIMKIIDEELPDADEVEGLMKKLGLPTSISELGTDEKLLPDIFLSTKDIRDKYVLPRLLWDLGIIDDFVSELK